MCLVTAEDDTDSTDTGKDASAKSEKARIMFILKGMGYETKTKEDVEKAVKEIAKLSLEEKNYKEIINRLEIESQEQQEV